MMPTFAQLLDILMPPRPTERLLRTLRDDGLTNYLYPRAITQPYSSPITALSSYAEPYMHAAVIETKFHGNKRAARLLGSLVASYIGTLGCKRLLLLPIPLSTERRKARGYNQVERIASEAARLLPGTARVRTDILVRTRDTPPQTSLGRRDRLKNLAGAFDIRTALDPHHTYIVLDDVTTTGSTLIEAVRALSAAGAKHVMPIAVAHQPIGNSAEMQYDSGIAAPAAGRRRG